MREDYYQKIIHEKKTELKRHEQQLEALRKEHQKKVEILQQNFEIGKEQIFEIRKAMCAVLQAVTIF